MLALFVGREIITKVPPLLHTPLMSGSNAISGITIVGALLSVAAEGLVSTILGFLALVLATINVVAGFLVTHRMVGMFKKRD
jgi:NAD(P) transhydrogenase subunit alpha